MGCGEMTGPENGFSMLGGLVRPASRGEITLTGPSPEDPLRIDLGALSEQADVDALVASVRQCREIGRSEALASWEPKELHPGPGVSDSDEDLAQYVRDSVVTYHHQVGTCRMGTDDLAVVDPADLRVRGLSGIRIADASVMPHGPHRQHQRPHGDDRRACRRDDPELAVTEQVVPAVRQHLNGVFPVRLQLAAGPQGGNVVQLRVSERAADVVRLCREASGLLQPGDDV